jgi:YVTN family beta-propeller protein
MKIKVLLALSLFLSLFSACEKAETEPTQPYDTGVIVINSGNFSDNNGTLTQISRNDQTATFDIFQKENLRSISGGLSGYTEVNNKGIILVDNSSAGKDLIEIVNARTFKSIATIPSSEIENPRNVIEVSATKAYITAWDATGDFSNFFAKPGYVAVLDLNTDKMVKKITVQNGAETLFKVENEVYVGNNSSGKSILSVIDIATDAVKQTIEVGNNPHIIGLDASGKLWIYAGGEFKKINTISKTIENKMKITSDNPSKSPSSFAISADKSTIYYTYSFYDAADGFKQKGETYSFKTSNTSVEAKTPFINRLFGGGLAVDPQTGNLYAGLVPSFKQAGFVFRYKSNGSLIDSVKAEIAPSKFFFKD